MKHQILFTKKAKKDLDSLPKNIKSKCIEVLKRLQYDPNRGKILTGELSLFRSIRMSSYRIIYKKINNKLIIEIITIKHRKMVYKRIK